MDITIKGTISEHGCECSHDKQSPLLKGTHGTMHHSHRKMHGPKQSNSYAKCKKAKWLSGEALQIAVKRREVKSKGE